MDSRNSRPALDLFAQFVSARDHHTVDDDAKMFFALTAAIHDAGTPRGTQRALIRSAL
jgi:hypothetical protein